MSLSHIVERGVLAFALWTAAVQVVVLLSGSLVDAVLLFGAFALAAVAAVWRWGWPERGNPPEPDSGEPARRFQDRLFVGLLLGAIILTSIAHRPDIDDALYLNLAVSAVDDPGSPLQKFDRQHLTEADAQLRKSSRLVSLPALTAALSGLTGVPAIYFPHVLFSTLAAFAMMVAYRDLFRILAPRYWACGVLATVVFLIADGEMHRSYGNFSFVRLHQGKGIVAAVFVPLILAYALELAGRPGRGSLLRLAAAQIAAVGCSSSGLLVAPVVANLGVLAGLGASPKGGRLRVAWLGLLSSLPVLLGGLWSRWRVLSAVSGGAEVRLGKAPLDVGENTLQVIGDGGLMVFGLVVLLTTWLVCERSVARRVCLLFPAALALVFLTDRGVEWMGAYVVPPAVYWRAWWIVPLPAMVGLFLLAPLVVASRRSAVTSRGRWMLFALLLTSPIALSEQTILSPDNGVVIRWPGLKVPEHYAVARKVDAYVSSRPGVLAPETVSAWLPTFRRHPYPVLSRMHYANRSRFPHDRDRRLRLKKYVVGRGQRPLSPEKLRADLEHYTVACVVIETPHRWGRPIREGLDFAGFSKVETYLRHEIWLKDSAGEVP